MSTKVGSIYVLSFNDSYFKYDIYLISRDEAAMAFTVTPTTPKFYKYAWTNSPDVKVVRVLASSVDTTCATMSVQGPIVWNFNLTVKLILRPS